MAGGPRTRRVWDDRDTDGEVGPGGWVTVPVVKVRCGKCQRPLIEAGSRIGRNGSDWRPSPGRNLESATSPYGGPSSPIIFHQQHLARHERLKLPCHPKRCGAVWTVRSDRMKATVAAALDAGRGEITVPYDLRGTRA